VGEASKTPFLAPAGAGGYGWPPPLIAEHHKADFRLVQEKTG
jgi:hypothetical protein